MHRRTVNIKWLSEMTLSFRSARFLLPTGINLSFKNLHGGKSHLHFYLRISPWQILSGQTNQLSEPNQHWWELIEKKFFSVLPEVFRLENKQLTQHGVPIDEDIGETVESNKDYALPSTLSRIIERTDDNSGCYIPRALLVWDAIISCLTVMDMADRIVYFNCVSQLLSVIMPRLFGLCPLDPG